MKKILALILLCTCAIANLQAQDKEFWFVAPESLTLGVLSDDDPAFMVLTNTTNAIATVHLYVYGGSSNPTDETITIMPKSSYRKDWITSRGIGDPSSRAGTVQNYGIHVVSDQNLTVYWEANFQHLKDLFSLKGAPALGTDFYIPFQNDHFYREWGGRPEEFHIVATEDGTVVNFTPNVDCMNTGGATYLRGNTYNVTLNKGQTFCLLENAPPYLFTYALSGSHIWSNKPIACTVCTINTSGEPSTPVATNPAGDTAGDQIVPVSSLGKRYVVVKGFSTNVQNDGVTPITTTDRVYFTGTEAGTTITITYEIGGATTTTTLTVGAGDTQVFDMGNSLYNPVGPTYTPNDPAVIYVAADKPIYCFHHSAVNDEIGGALLSSLYSIGQKELSFFQLGLGWNGSIYVDAINENYAFIVFRDTCEDYFTISYLNNITNLPVTASLPMTANPIPGMPDWNWAKVKLPATADDRVVTIKNSESAFSLGYFAFGNLATVPHTASYGYLSSFGTFQFDPDTNWRCNSSDPVTLVGGYALTYKWTLPDGSIQTTPVITAREDGMYILEMDQDPRIVIDTCWVQTLHFDAKVSHTPDKPAKVGVPQLFTTTVNASLASMLTYEWTFEGGNPSTSNLASPVVTWNTTGRKYVAVRISATAGSGPHAVNCDTTIVYRDRFNDCGEDVEECDGITVYDPHIGFFVDKDRVDGRHNGTNWQNAFQNVYEALDWASQGDCIWVAEGSYLPKSDGKSFVMDYDSVEMYGGFGGWEANISERDYASHPTILEGRDSSVVIFDGGTVYTNGSCGVSRATRLDGFTVRGGEGDNGAGILFRNGASGTVANSIIKNNAAKMNGGGIYIGGANTSCVTGAEDPLLYNNEISGNQAKSGAGIYNDGSKFVSLNNTISGNVSPDAAGLYNDGDADVRNTIIWGNLTNGALGADVTNGGGTAVYSYSNIAGWSTALGEDGTHNIDKNPVFYRKGYDDNLMLREGIYKLANSSPSVDKGRNAYVIGGVTNRISTVLLHPVDAKYGANIELDLAAYERIYNGVVDMGAYEYRPDADSQKIVHEVVVGTYPNVTTDPAAGIHYVIGHNDFELTLTPVNGFSLDYITVTTGSKLQDEQGGTLIKKNPDGTVTIIFQKVSEPLDIKIDGVSPTANEAIGGMNSMWVKDGNLYVQVATTEQLNIYTLTGQLFKQQTVGAGETVIPMPQGVYIVTLANGAKQKVVIK